MSTSPLQIQSVFEGGLGELGKNKRKRQASIYDAVAGCHHLGSDEPALGSNRSQDTLLPMASR